MQTYNDLIRRWNNCGGGQILVDAAHPIKNMYLNINEKGNRELLIPVAKAVKQFQSTNALGISNYRNQKTCYFAIELLEEALLKEYACLCFDLIQTSKKCATQKEAVDTLFETFKKWYHLMSSARQDVLSTREIRGLMGELKYMSDELELGRDEIELVNAWTTHKDASRDFVFDQDWSEIKTIQSSADYVSISSIEQLDHLSCGNLVVYRLDQTSNSGADTVTLNGLVDALRLKLGTSAEVTLNKKLLTKGYVYNETYESMFFSFGKKDKYLVDASFPCIRRSMLPGAVCAAVYQLSLSEIEGWKNNGNE